jgi:hypothetical protein
MNAIKDLLLDEETHDLKIVDYDLNIVEGQDAILQNTSIRLLFFKGEYFLDTLAGLPLYEDILVKNPNLSRIDAIMKAHILDTPGVKELLAYESAFDPRTRRLTVTFTVDTDFGSVTNTEVL